MKKILLLLFSITCFYSAFAQGDITVDYDKENCTGDIYFYDASLEVTSDGKTYYGYVNYPFFRIVFVPANNRWEYQYIPREGSAISYSTDLTSPKPPATGWSPTPYTGCGSLTLSGDVAVLTLSPGTLPDASIGAAYSQTISASGGTAPYSYASGTLPPGLMLNTGTGELSGTPTTARTYKFTLTASDASSEMYPYKGSKDYTVKVKKYQTISFLSSADKTYGDADFDPGATASSGLAVSYASGNTDVATIVGGKIHIVGAGTATITASQAGNDEWGAADDKTQELTVTKKALTVTATGQNKTYDGNTDATVILGDDRVSGDVLTAAYTAAAFDNKNAGTGKTVSVSGISLSGSDAGNYSLPVTTASTTADITAKTLTVTATGQDKTYDGSTDATVTLGDDRISGDVLSTSYTAAAFDNKDAGTGKTVSVSGISLSGSDAGNYSLPVTTASTTADITTKTLTITVTGQNKTYDGNTEATVTLSDDRISGDVLSTSYTAAAFDNKNAGTGKAVSVSGISLSGSDAGNYSLAATTTSTTADITTKTLTITVTGQNKTYDGSTDATVSLAISGDGPVTGDDVTVNYTSAGFGDKNTGTGKPVEITGVSLGGSDAANYSVNTTASTTADITAKPLTVTATGQDKVYDGSTDATVSLAISGDGPVTGDDVTVNYTSAGFGDKNTGTGKPVEITGVSLGGNDAANYSVNAAASTTADITTRALTVTAAADNKEYDGNTTATVTLGDNRVSGDNITTAYTAATFDSKDAGTGKTVNITGITIGGTDAGNYSVNANASTTADITARTLTVTATGQDKVYDGSTDATVSLAISGDGPVTGDDVTVNYTSAGFGDKNTGTDKPVEITGISLGGNDAANYSVNAAASATADITARALTVTAAADNKEYDGSTDATVSLAISGDGPVAGDDVTVNYTSAGFGDKNTGTGKPVEITGISLGGSDAANYSVNAAASATADITTRALTVTAAADNKEYDGNTTATVTLGDNRVSGDNITTAYTAATFDNKDAGTGKAVNVTGISLSGSDAGNYALGNTTASTTADIKAKTLTVTADAKNKTYDGSTDATVTLAISGDGSVAGDDVTVNYTSAGFGDKNVGTDKPVKITGVSLGGSDAANYSVNAAASTTADITARALTVTADAKSKTYGDADPALTYTATGFAAGDDKSVLSGTLSREPGEDAGTYAIQLGSLSAVTNYTLTFTGADFTITNNRILTVTADAKSKVYGNTDPELSYTATGFAAGEDESILSGTLTREPGEDVDTYAIQLGNLSAGANYTINFVGADFTIGNKVLTVTADAGQSKIYGATDPTFTYTATGFENGDNESVLNGALSREAGEAVGTYAIQLGSLSAGANYTINYSGADFAITPATLDITVDAGQSKIYGATDPTFTYTATGFENGDNESVLNGALSREAGEAVGTYAIQLGSLSAGANYTINYSGADFAITPATLDITVDVGQSKIYGATDPTFTYTTSGFANGDDESILSGALSREAGEAVGTYAIQLDNLSAGTNYTLTFTGADFTIGKKAITVTADAKSKTYGDTDPELTYTATGFAAGDDKSVLSGTLTRETGEDADTYAIQLGSLSAGTNYTLSFTGAEFTVDRKALTVTATGQDKVYDGSTDATVSLAISGDGPVTGDDVTVNYTSAGFGDKNVGTDKPVEITGVSLGGSDAANYSVNAAASTTADITVRTLTVTADTKSKTYGDADPALTYTATGFAAGDDKSVLSGTLSREPGEDAGTYAIQLGSLSAVTNYTLTFTGADFTITNNRILTVTADAKSKVYGNTDPELSYTATGFANGDDESILSGTLTREPGEDVDTYAIQLGNLSAGANYTINFVGADFTIGNKVLTVTADAGQSKIYGATDPTFTYTATGFENGDNESVLNGALSREAGEAVGTYAIQLGSLSAGANYTINYSGADFAITPATLDITVDAGQSKIYGATDPTFTYTATGFENGDNESVLNGALSREAGEAVGTYAIQLGSLSAGANYTINYSGADFAITPATLDITVDVGQSKIYGATDPTFTYTTSGFANGDDESILSGALSREAGEAVGTYAIQLDNLSAGTNYTLTFTGADFTIGKKAITVTADAKSKTYGDTDPVLTYTATGFAAGDDKSVLSGTLTRVTGEDAGTYAIQLGSLSAGANYTLTFTGADFTITNNRILTVTADAKSKTYGDADPALTYTVTGFANGDDGSVLSGTLSREAGEDAGTYAIQLGSLSAGANYTLSFTGAEFTVDRKALTVTATGQDKVYDGSTDATVSLAISGDGPVTDDDVTVNYTSAGFGDKNTGTGKPVEITGISLGGSDAANYSVNAAASTTADITTRALTVTAAADNKEYDGNTTATVTLGDNRVSGDNITTAYTAATFDNKDAGTGKTVNITGITIGGTDGGNYSLAATTASTTADITARTLTVTATGQDKVYDGSTDATVSLAISGDGPVTGDDVTVNYTSAGFGDKNVGTDKPVEITGVSLGGSDAANYSVNAAASTTADITVRTLTVTADAKSKTYGDTDPVLTYTATGFATGDDKSILSGTLTREPGEDAGTYAIQLGSLSAGTNYTLTFTGADFTIGKKAITVTTDAKSKTYGDADPELTYTVSGFASGDDGSVLSGSLTREAGEDAGTYAIGQGSLSAGTNYTLSFTGAEFTVDRKALTVTATGQDKVYNGSTDATVTLAISGDGPVTGDDVTVNYTSAGFGDKNTGTDKPVEITGISLGGSDAANYSVNTTASTTADVTAKPLTVTATGQDKVYDGSTDATVSLAISGDGPVAGDDVTVNYTSAEFGDKNTGTDKPVEITGISLEGNDAANYSANAAASTTADITVRTLTVTADAKSKTYGDADPVLTYTATGFAAGDDESVLSGTLSREPGEDAGTYAIQLGSLSAVTNYTLTFTGADFTITNNRILTVTADAKSKTYGDADPALTYTVTGFANGDDGSVLSGSLTREAGEDAGTYAIQLGSLSAGTNYTLSFTGAEFTVDRKALTVTATGQDKVYDGSTDATVSLAISGDGPVTGDDVTVNYTSAGFGDKNTGTGKPVEITGVSLGGSDAANYSVNAAVSTTADITVRTLTVTADAKSKTYGAADPELTYTVTGFANGDDESILSGTLTRVTGEDAGTYAIQLGSLSGGTNYTLSFTGADFVISNKKVLTVTADAKSKVYGAADPVLTYTATGFANGDDKSVLSGTLTREAGEDAGTYAIQLGSLSAGTNYTLSFTGAEFTIIRNDETDTDGDGVPDEIEDAEGSDPGDPKNYLDTDGDNVPDYVENQDGTNPDDGSDYPDTDADRVPDYVEERDGTDPGDPQDFFDSDSDGVADYVQVRSIKEFVPQTLRVAWGTPVETVPYPGEVVAITSQDEFINMAVSWDLSGYDPVKPGSSSYPGTIKETGGLFNGYNRVPMLEISVQPKPAPENVTLGNSEFIGNPETFFQEIGAFTVVDPSDDIHEISLLAGEGDNRFFEVKSGILFWSSTDEAAGRTEFTVVVKVTDRAGNELVKPFAIRRLRTPLKDLELFNAFTPNGDGMNDTWGIPALRYYSGVRIQVFDNGGQRLFYTEDADTRWDGKYGGKELPVGAYFYVIEVRETGETRRGTLNLLTE